MPRINRIVTVTATASLAAAVMAAPASATHIPSHAVEAIKQDAQALGQDVQDQAQSAREAADRAGSNSRRFVRRTAVDRMRSTSRTVRETRSSAQSRVAGARSRVESHASDTIAATGRRVNAARQRASEAVAPARSRVSRTRSVARRRVDETKATAVDLVALVQQRLYAFLKNGSVLVSSDGEEYSAGWTLSDGCWNGRMSTPLNPPRSRFRRRTGFTLQPTAGRRTKAETSQGDVSASTGC